MKMRSNSVALPNAPAERATAMQVDGDRAVALCVSSLSREEVNNGQGWTLRR